MDKSPSQPRKEPRPTRVPAQRADGLDPELTAQPRSIPDEVALDDSEDPGLPVDPDELGVRFLSEAIEQGDFVPLRATERELSIFESPSDEPLVGPNFSEDRDVWEQAVDLTLQSRGDAAALRSPAPVAALDDAPFDDARDEEDASSLDIPSSSIRELSLFDREGPEGDETIAPEVMSEEGGRHARETPRAELGAQVEELPEENVRSQERQSGVAPAGTHQADSGKQSRTQAALRFAARTLRKIAVRLHG
jgi:hypothetical protein